MTLYARPNMWNMGMTDRATDCCSPGTSGGRAHPLSRLLASTMALVRFWWVTITPFGGPVVPLENGKIARVLVTSNSGFLS